MSRSTALVKASTDKTLPTTYQGTIPPNHYCRGWNEKRKKYCKQRAGQKTKHPGVGRCKHHGGQQAKDKRVTHGQSSRVISTKLATLIAEALADPKPLDMLPVLAHAKAMLQDAVVKYDAAGGLEGLDALLRAVDTTSKVAYRIEQIRAHGTVSIDRIRLFLLALDRVIELRVVDDRLKQQLRADIHGIRV